MRTRAEKRDGTYVLNGQKFGSPTAASPTSSASSRSPIPQRARAASPRSSSRRARPDLPSEKLEKKDGHSRLSDGRARLCRLPGSGGEPLGDEGQGFKIAMKVLDKSRPGIAAQALGIAAGALEYATGMQGARRLRQADRQHQGVEFMLADMQTEVESARLLLYEAARNATKVRPTSRPGRRWRSSSAATSRCSVTTDAVQVLGGFGYSADYPVERMMRDAKITQIYEGTQQIQRIVIARNLVGRAPS